MTWRNLFQKSRHRDEPAGHPTQEPVPAPSRIVGRRAPERPPTPQDPDQRRIAGLQRQRLAILYDIEQGELASAPDNPWTSRIALLTEALDTVAADRATASQVEPGPWHPVPETAITFDRVEVGDASTIALSVGDEHFVYAEEPDWAERGHQVARPELTHRSGEVNGLELPDTPVHLVPALREHLAHSLLVLASDVRDRALDNEQLPASPTLANLAAPCPTCGGWTDWRGTCQACARRAVAVSALKREETRLLDERNREAEERHRLLEGLPIAHRRLRDVETEITRLGGVLN